MPKRDRAGRRAAHGEAHEPPATHAELEGLFAQLAETLTRSISTKGPRAGIGAAQVAPPVPAREPNERDVRLLRVLRRWRHREGRLRPRRNSR